MPFGVCRRRQPARAAAHDRMVRPRLQFRRHVRPNAVEARADIANAHLVPTAIAALTEAPERQRFAIQPANRLKGGFALRRLFIRRQAFVEEAAPFGFLRFRFLWWSMILSQNRFPLFRIMLQRS